MKKYTEICKVCREVMTVAKDVVIIFRGFSFSILKPVGVCYGCFKKQVIKGLKHFERDGYFKVSKGQVIVNWNKCLEARECSADENDLTWDCILIRLVDLGVLSFKADGNYIVERDGVYFLLNADQRYYFARQRDPVEFIEAYRDRYKLTKEGFMVLKLIAVYRV